jgi:hypothetical protein
MQRVPHFPTLILATAHAYFCLLVVHCFFQRENIQKQIYSAAYATEVTYRDKQFNLRRQAERQFFETLGQVKDDELT